MKLFTAEHAIILLHEKKLLCGDFNRRHFEGREFLQTTKPCQVLSALERQVSQILYVFYYTHILGPVYTGRNSEPWQARQSISGVARVVVKCKQSISENR